MNVIIVSCILIFIFGITFLFIKRKKQPKITNYNPNFGSLLRGSVFSFIDNTTNPFTIRIGYIVKTDKNGILFIHTPSLGKVVRVKKSGSNYFLLK